MRNLFFLSIVLLIVIQTKGQIAINTDGSSANESSILDIKSTDKGILIPRMTLSQRNNISSPTEGLMVYQTDGEKGFYFYNGSSWDIIQNQMNSFTQDQYIFFESTTTWTCPQGVYTIIVELWGGAGGAGGTARSNTGATYNPCVFTAIGMGGKGGAGGYTREIANVTPGETYNIIIGEGGAGGEGANQIPFTGELICAENGNNGGSSSFGGIISAPGGEGGEGGCARVNSPCLQDDGNAGNDGVIVDYEYVPSRSYTPSKYLRPSCCSEGGEGWVDEVNYYGNNGEDGLIIITY